MAGPAIERAFPAQPTVSGAGQIIASPFQFYTTGEERLRVVSANSLTGVRLKIQARFIDRGGTIQANSWDHVPNTDRSIRSDDVELGTGALLNLTVFAGTGAPLVGQTFVMVQLVRGVGAAAIVLGTLLAGYVTATQALGWPGSPIESSIAGGGYVRTITGTTPGVGQDISETVPTGARWELLAVWARLFTSAAVANRFAVFTVFDPANHLVQSAHPNAQVASAQGQYSWANGFNAQLVTATLVYQAPLPMHLAILAGQKFTITLINQDAGDQWDPPYFTVREWLEVQ